MTEKSRDFGKAAGTGGLVVEQVPVEAGEHYPPKMTITPEGSAGLFLLAHCPNAGKIQQETLTELLKLFWRGGWDAAKKGKPRA